MLIISTGFGQVSCPYDTIAEHVLIALRSHGWIGLLWRLMLLHRETGVWYRIDWETTPHPKVEDYPEECLGIIRASWFIKRENCGSVHTYDSER